MSKFKTGEGIVKLAFGMGRKIKDLKVIPYQSMTRAQFDNLDKFLGRLAAAQSMGGLKLTKAQQNYFLNQVKQLELYRERVLNFSPEKDAAVRAYEQVMDKVKKGVPLNPSDKAKLEAAGFKPDASKDLFKGFEPKVIEGSKGETPFTDIVQKEIGDVKLYGNETFDEIEFIRKNKKHPRDKKSKGGLIAAIMKLNKKYGKGTIKKAKDMKRPKKAIEKEELEQLFKSFKEKHGFAGGGVAHMLGYANGDRVRDTDYSYLKDMDPEILKHFLKRLNEREMTKQADGGRIGFADGGMSRRTFLKIMGAIAAFPVVGKFFKGAKVANKVSPMVTQTKDMPAHFPKLVEKILKEGKIVSAEKSGFIKKYQHPTRKDIEMEVQGDGDQISVTFETDQGAPGYYEYRKGDIIEEGKFAGQREGAEFKEAEELGSVNPDGDVDTDITEFIDTGTENLDEFVGMSKQPTSKSKIILQDPEYSKGGVAGLLGE